MKTDYLQGKNLQGTQLTANVPGEERVRIQDKQIKQQGSNSNAQSILEGQELHDAWSRITVMIAEVTS